MNFVTKFMQQSEKHEQLYGNLSTLNVPSVPKNSDVVVISIPKSGTYLIKKFIELLLDRSIYQGHLQYSENNIFLRSHHNVKVIIPMRDPRDTIVSSIPHHDKSWINSKHGFMCRHYYNPLDPYNPMSCAFTKEFLNSWQQTSFSEKLRISIDPEVSPPISPFYDYELLDEFVEKRSDNTLVVKFENIIGKKGGGSDELQAIEVQRTAKFLGIPFSEKLCKKVRNNLFGGTTTFRKGVIGEWRKTFNQEHVDLFKEVAGELLIKYGYEKDLKWGLSEEKSAAPTKMVLRM